MRTTCSTEVYTFCVISHSIKGETFVLIFICPGFVSTPKGQVVWRSSLCPSYTSDEFIGTFREITSNPSLLPTHPLHSFVSPHGVHPRFSLFPLLPSSTFHSSLCPLFFFIISLSHFIAIFLHPFPPTKALQRDHLSIKCRDV